MQCENKLSTTGGKTITRKGKSLEKRPGPLDHPYGFEPSQQGNESQLWQKNPTTA